MGAFTYTQNCFHTAKLSKKSANKKQCNAIHSRVNCETSQLRN